jgi:Tn3 transposase DDE domain
MVIYLLSIMPSTWPAIIPVFILIAKPGCSHGYVALFSHFIPCGTLEAVYIIDGLLKNQSDIQPERIHANTQGQSGASRFCKWLKV